jgi:hypothetical protein
MRKVLIALSLIVALAAQAGHIQNMIYARRRASQNFTIHFASGTPPATITLHADYTGPASASAQYDPGDGVWKSYSSNTIAIEGSYIRFRGDWRTSVGVYNAMFYDTFAGAGYTVETSGALAYAATADNAYREMFRGCTSLVALRDNPFQPITGSLAAYMFRYTFHGNDLSSLPAGCCDTSGLTGSPASYMFYGTFYDNSLTSLPDGCMDTSGLTGSPAANMFRTTFFDNNLQTTDFVIGSGITLTDANISANNPLSYMFYNNAEWTGELYWGTNVIHNVLTPTADINTFAGCVDMPDYDTIDANWK